MDITDILNEVISILMNCEEIQDSNESAYTKEQAKITAYNEILEALTSYEM